MDSFLFSGEKEVSVAIHSTPATVMYRLRSPYVRMHVLLDTIEAFDNVSSSSTC